MASAWWAWKRHTGWASVIWKGYQHLCWKHELPRKHGLVCHMKSTHLDLCGGNCWHWCHSCHLKNILFSTKDERGKQYKAQIWAYTHVISFLSFFKEIHSFSYTSSTILFQSCEICFLNLINAFSSSPTHILSCIAEDCLAMYVWGLQRCSTISKDGPGNNTDQFLEDLEHLFNVSKMCGTLHWAEHCTHRRVANISSVSFLSPPGVTSTHLNRMCFCIATAELLNTSLLWHNLHTSFFSRSQYCRTAPARQGCHPHFLFTTSHHTERNQAVCQICSPGY